MQFSSEDDNEFDEVHPFENEQHHEEMDVDSLGISGLKEEPEIPADDDSQQAAEAMVQLGNVGFYVGEQQLLQQGIII